MMLAPTLTMGAASAGAFANAVVVSGAGTAAVNGTYEKGAPIGGFPSYVNGSNVIANNATQWEITQSGTIMYRSGGGEPTPWSSVWSDVEGAAPVPTVTPARA